MPSRQLACPPGVEPRLFGKTPLKKSASSVLSATSRFSCATCSRSSRSLLCSGGACPPSIASNRSRHLYSSRRCTPSSSERTTMLSQPFRRSTAIFRNALGYFPTRRLATRGSLPCKLCQFGVSQFWNSVHNRVNEVPEKLAMYSHLYLSKGL